MHLDLSNFAVAFALFSFFFFFFFCNFLIFFEFEFWAPTPEPPKSLDQVCAHTEQWMCKYYWNDLVKNSYPLCI